MISHQTTNSFCENYNGVFYHAQSWEYHLHRSFEFLILTEGSVRVRIGSDLYELGSGDSVLVPPFVPHSIDAAEDSAFFVAVFSGNYAEDVARLFKSKRAESYKFSLTKRTEDYISEHLYPNAEKTTDYGTPMPKPKSHSQEQR